MIDVAEARDLFDASTDGTVGIEEEFALLDSTFRLTPAFERLRDAGLEVWTVTSGGTCSRASE